MTTAATGARIDTLKQDLHETVRQLNAALGTTLVAYLANSKDQKASIRWARVDGPVPRAETRRRLLDAHQAWTQIASTHSEYIARNWFIAANPRLDEDSPVERLRAGDSKAVMNAVTALIEGNFH